MPLSLLGALVPVKDDGLLISLFLLIYIQPSYPLLYPIAHKVHKRWQTRSCLAGTRIARVFTKFNNKPLALV